MYGTNTKSKTPEANTIQQREPFINTYSSYNIQTVAIANGGAGFTTNDVGTICQVSLSSNVNDEPLKIIIKAVTNGAITTIAIVDYGSYLSAPGLTGAIIPATGSSGNGASVNVTLFLNPSIEAGGGLYVADATSVPNKVVQVTGSLAAQDHTAVNITGGNVYNTNMPANNIIASSIEKSNMNNSTVTNSSIVGGANSYVGTLANPISNLYISNTPLPSGVTSQGVLVLGSDGKVYVTNTPLLNGLQVTNLVATGGINIGPKYNINTSSFNQGELNTQGDITAFSPLN